MPVRRLKEYLDENHVKYVTITHSYAFTAQEIAASAHIKGHDLAKAVMVKLDGTMTMAVIPASTMLNFTLLKHAAGAETAELATEAEFKGLFPNCEPGAMPPFGNLYRIPVFMEESLRQDDEIAFNAGSHTELVRLPLRDYVRLVEPRIVEISTEHVSRTT